MPKTGHSDPKDGDDRVRTRGRGSVRQENLSVKPSDLDDAFEDEARPGQSEAISAPTDAGLLSSLDVETYVRRIIEGQRPVGEQPVSQSSVESTKEKLTAAQE